MATPARQAPITVVAPNPTSKSLASLPQTVLRSNSETSKPAVLVSDPVKHPEESDRKRAYSEPVNIEKENLKTANIAEPCETSRAELGIFTNDTTFKSPSPVDLTADLTETLENMAVFEVPASLLTEGLPLLKISHKSRKKIRLWVDSSQFKFVYKHESKNKSHSFYIDDLRSVTPRELASHYREEFGISKDVERRWISVAYFDHRKNKTKHLHLIAETSHDSKRLLYTVCKFKAIRDRIAADFLVDLKDLDEVKRSILSGKAAVSEKSRSKSPKQALSFQEVVKYCRRLSINVPEEKLHALFFKAASSSKDEIDFEEFKKFVTLLTQRNDIRSIFAKYSSTANMTLEEFGRFLTVAQGENFDASGVASIYNKFAVSTEGTSNSGMDGQKSGSKSNCGKTGLTKSEGEVKVNSKDYTSYYSQDSSAGPDSEMVDGSIPVSNSDFDISRESTVSAANKSCDFHKTSNIGCEKELEPMEAKSVYEFLASDMISSNASETDINSKPDTFKSVLDPKSSLDMHMNQDFHFASNRQTDTPSNATTESSVDPITPLSNVKKDSKFLMRLNSSFEPPKPIKSSPSSQVDSMNSGNRSTTSETEPPSGSGVESDTGMGIFTKMYHVETSRDAKTGPASYYQNSIPKTESNNRSETKENSMESTVSEIQDSVSKSSGHVQERPGIKSMVDSVLGEETAMLNQLDTVIHNGPVSGVTAKRNGDSVVRSGSNFGPECLAAYLKSSICTPSKLAYTSDDSYFTHPLTDYYIFSSHNTYLTGRQVVGDSSVEGYVKALQRGCRCLEIDVWNQADPNLEPIVNHGRTFTSGISLTNVLLTIKKFAFQTTRFPLILSLEVHCSLRAQVIMAQILKDVFGPALITKPIDSRTTVPSPAELKDKVLIKVKKGEKLGPKGSESLSSLDENGRFVNSSTTQTSYSESNDSASVPKFKLRRKDANIAEPLSKLGVYCQGIKFRNFSLPESKTYNHIFSLSEKSANSMLRDSEKAAALDKHNRKFFMRIYPSKIRLNSSNFVPLMYWEHGVQMVATNWQRYDLGQQINEAFFDITQGCGYVLKPAELRKAVMKATLRDHVTTKKESVTRFRIEVVSAQQLPNVQNVAGSTGIVNPFVTVEILGAHTHTWDLHSRTGPSEVVAENGFNPKWNVVYAGHFTADTQLVFLRLAIHTSSSKTSVESPKEICISMANIFDLKQGYRHLPLKDLCGELLKYSSVFVNVKYETKS